MRTPEETVMLANGLEFDAHCGDGEPGYLVLCRVGAGERLIVEGPYLENEDDWMHPFVHLAADLAEARAEVAALRADAAKLSELLDAEENKAINLVVK